jgi:enamine deaminase RidA (YjgF/YER057c/UK114 family)
MPIKRVDPGQRLSRAVIHGDTVYIAGHVASDPALDVTGQTRQILARIDTLLAELGTDKSKILSATVWLADMATFDDMNSVWDAWVSPGSPPARACVESKLASPRYRVEIAAIAALRD